MNSQDASYFSSLPHYYVYRPHLVSTVLSLLDTRTNAVLLDGPPGLGYTSFLAEVAQTSSQLTLSLFVNSASRLAYSPEYLAETLANQAELLLSRIPSARTSSSELPDEQQSLPAVRLRRALIRLHRRANAQRQYILILVDGLHQVPPEDKGYVEEVLRDVLPFGIQSFRFVITVANSRLGSSINHGIETRLFTLVTLSPGECETLCVANDLDKTNGIDIYEITKGHPGKVASALRLLQAGLSISSLSGHELAEFFTYEWDAIPERSDEIEAALAYVTFSRRPVSISEVIKYSGCPFETLDKLAKSETFVKKIASSESLELIGDGQRRFLEQKLHERKPEIVRKLIDELAENPKGELALRFLPTYYETLHRTHELIQYLDADTLARYLETGQSVSELLRQTELGFRTAQQAKELQDVLRFALNISFVRDADSSDVWAPRLSALTALGHFEDAYAVTQLPATQEERLYLMSLFAKATYEQGISKDDALEERIRAISDSIDMAALGDRAVDILTRQIDRAFVL